MARSDQKRQEGGRVALTADRPAMTSWLEGVLQLQDMANVNRNCIPGPVLCFGDVFIPHFPPSALSVWQEMEV